MAHDRLLDGETSKQQQRRKTWFLCVKIRTSGLCPGYVDTKTLYR